MKSVPISPNGRKSAAGPQIRPADVTARLEAVAVWVARAKATLCAIDQGYQQLRRESEDPASPLHWKIDLQDDCFNIVDHGISVLDNMVIPGLSAV